MNNKLAIVLSGITLLSTAVAATAIAGAKVAGTVQVNPTERWAKGGMGAARAANDSTTYVGCQVQVIEGGIPSMNCVARDSANRLGYCASDDPNIIQIMGAMNSDSFVHFEWDENQTCTTVYVSTHSAYQPK